MDTVKVYMQKDLFDEPRAICISSPSPAITTEEKDGKSYVRVSVGECRKGRVRVLASRNKSDNCLLCVQGCSAQFEGRKKPGASISRAPAIPAPLGNPCGSKCLDSQKIRWGEGYTSHSRFLISPDGSYDSVEYKKSDGTMITRVKVPKICGLDSMFMKFEISPQWAEWHPKGTGEIPEDNSLKYIHDDEWVIRWPYSEVDSGFFPGESIVVYARVRKEDGKCREFPIAFAWYETPCLTSATIQGAGLVVDTVKTIAERLVVSKRWNSLDYDHIHDVSIPDADQFEIDYVRGLIRLRADSWAYENQPVSITYKTTLWRIISGGDGQPLKDEWVGDPRLTWCVNFKGGHYWLKSSDYASFTIGERVIIRKGGLTQGGELNSLRRCRMIDVGNVWAPYFGDDIVSDSSVSYTLRIDSDVILPLRILL